MQEIKEESLVFSQSPMCPLAADVISDGFSIYFYMYDLNYEEQQLFARSACWIKNLVDAPESFDKDWIAEDHQPVVPKMFIADSMDKDEWKQEDLEIIWSKEGHIAGLYYKDNLISVIPSWADGKNFPGYSKYTSENSMVAWKLSDAIEILEPRMEEGRQFWKQEFNLLWEEYNTNFVTGLKERFGETLHMYDLNKDQFPSRLLLTYEKGNYVYAFTLGVGMFNMPNADRYYDEYEEYACCEFAICLSKDDYNEEEQLQVFSAISSICALPWKQIDCLADKHTLEIPLKNTEIIILLNDDRFKDHMELPCKREGINLLWITPLSDIQFEEMKDEQKKEVLIDMLVQKGHEA